MVMMGEGNILDRSTREIEVLYRIKIIENNHFKQFMKKIGNWITKTPVKELKDA
jgi:hypothetical protein